MKAYCKCLPIFENAMEIIPSNPTLNLISRSFEVDTLRAALVMEDIDRLLPVLCPTYIRQGSDATGCRKNHSTLVKSNKEAMSEMKRG